MRKAISGFSALCTAIIAASLLAPGSARSADLSTRHLHAVVRDGSVQPQGRLPGSQLLNLNIVLPVRDKAALDAFVADVADPMSFYYRNYLTPAQFTERFGPSQADYDAVVAFARQHGLAVTGGSRDGMNVQVRGSVAAVEAAFHLNLLTYQHPTEDRVFYSPDREPTTSLAFPLWHISGLDDFSIPHPLLVSKNAYAQAHGIAPEAVVSHATTGSGPSASFLGSDMRAAYYGGTALTGAGQNLGLLEYYGTDLADLTTYYKNVKQTNTVPITLLSTDGTSTSCVYSRRGGNCDDTEQTLDMTQALGMAPGLASLTMYIGSTDTAIIAAMTTHSPLPTTIGCSWGWTPADPSTLDPYFEKMAAQGQSFFAASGDSSTWSASNEAWPADDAYVISVGGTDLTTAKAAGAWAQRNRLGGQRRRRLAGQDRDSVVAEARGRHQFQQQGLHHVAQWAGRFCECQFHLLYLWRPGCLPGQLLWWHQLRRAHVGGFHCAGQSEGSGQQGAARGVLQPDDLPLEHWVGLRHQFSRHHQRQVRQLLGRDRL